MNAAELLTLMPKAMGFFAVGEFPGVILPPDQGWLFDGGRTNPRPITRTEAQQLGAEEVPVDEAAELFSLHPEWLNFLKKKTNNSNSSTIPTNRATITAGGQLKARVVEKRKE